MAIPGWHTFWNVFTLKAKLTAIGIILLLILVAFGGYKACKWLNPPPKLDEKAIKKAQDAIAKQDRKEMLEILAESDTKEDEIDASVDQIEQKREEAKQNYTGLTNDELAAELEKRAKE
jgi:hypothetical protein